MANGHVHDKVTIAAGIPLAIATFSYTGSIRLTAGLMTAYLFAGLMFGPDLDTRSIPFQRWGPLKILWEPYRRRVNHRSPFSHGVLLGTITRIAYLLLVAVFLVAAALLAIALVALLLAYLNEDISITQAEETYRTAIRLLAYHGGTAAWSWLIANWRSLIGIFVYLELGAASHYVVDQITSGFKRKKRRRRRRRRRRS